MAAKTSFVVEKRKSGSYSVRVYDYTDQNGKKHYKRFSAPTRKEVIFQASSYSLNKSQVHSLDITLKKALEEYIAIKKSILSPSTLAGYQRMIKRFPEKLLGKSISDITSKDIDIFIGAYAENHSPKSVSNIYGFLSVVMKTNGIRLSEHKLPQKIMPEYYTPTDSEVKALLDYAKTIEGKNLYYAILLASYGCMRRGEICGLYAEDIKNNVVHIKTSRVESIDKIYVDKTTKTVSSDRYVELPQFVVDELPKKDRIITCNPNRITQAFGEALKKCNLPDFRFHDLRHYSASVMHAMGVPDQYIMERGGWKSDRVLKQVYRNTMSDYSKKYTDMTNEYFAKLQ